MSQPTTLATLLIKVAIPGGDAEEAVDVLRGYLEGVLNCHATKYEISVGEKDSGDCDAVDLADYFNEV